MRPHIVTLTGRSCAGKSTLELMLKERGFRSIISTTTRAPRAGERHGEQYYFIGRDAFEELDKTGEFIESVQFGGNHYGVSAEEVERVSAFNQPIALVVEPHGLTQIRSYARKHEWTLFTVFVDNPDHIIFARFLNRAFQDFAEGRITNIDISARRLETMTTVERGWPAARSSYSLYLDHFDQSNDLRVADLIAGVVGSLLLHSRNNDEGKAA